jgi:predicted kinase
MLERKASLPRAFNPDDYLWTAAGRVYTPERSAAAWEQLYADLEASLSKGSAGTRLYVVMGVQGGGKTTWIRANYDALGPLAVFLDAAVPAQRHRARALAVAQRCGAKALAVWIDTPLERALAQNAARPPDEIVPEAAVRSVFGLLEAPTTSEGFDEVIVVTTRGVAS